MLWLFVGPIGVYLLDFFCSGIQFYLLLSPYICYISLLYLDLYVFGDDAQIMPLGPKLARSGGGGHMFYIGLFRENHERIF